MMHSPIAAAAPASAWWTALNASIDGHIAKLAAHEANIDLTLADMAERHVEEAVFLERWSAMTYCEALAFQRERGAAHA